MRVLRVPAGAPDRLQAGLRFASRPCSSWSMPAYVEAIAWVSALAEPVTTFFGVIAVYGLLSWRRPVARSWKPISVGAFCLGPDDARERRGSAAAARARRLGVRAAARQARSLGDAGRRGSGASFPTSSCSPIYLLVDLVGEQPQLPGRRGPLSVRISRDPQPARLRGLAVRRQAEPAVVHRRRAGARGAAAARQSPRVVFATAWLLLAILPFSFFTWGNTSRYAYMPAVGMALLITGGRSTALDVRTRAAAARHGEAGCRRACWPPSSRVRFMLFAAENIRHFAEGTERYRQFAVAVRQRVRHPAPVRHRRRRDDHRQTPHRYSSTVRWSSGIRPAVAR